MNILKLTLFRQYCFNPGPALKTMLLYTTSLEVQVKLKIQVSPNESRFEKVKLISFMLMQIRHSFGTVAHNHSSLLYRRDFWVVHGHPNAEMSFAFSK